MACCADSWTVSAVLKKRLVGVITVRDGWGVQSFGYSRYLPLGHPERLAENLDRWGVDEIVVLAIDRARRGQGPDLDLVKRLGALGLSTPLAYGGGIRSAEDAGAVIQSGADRLCVDSVLHADPTAVRHMAALVGSQAVIGVLPMSITGSNDCYLNHLTREQAPLSPATRALFEERVISESLLVDWRREGQACGFDEQLVRRFPFTETPLIAFGGISEPSQMARLLEMPGVAAVAVGNFLAYREHAVQALKRELRQCPIRPAFFSSAEGD